MNSSFYFSSLSGRTMGRPRKKRKAVKSLSRKLLYSYHQIVRMKVESNSRSQKKVSARSAYLYIIMFVHIVQY